MLTNFGRPEKSDQRIGRLAKLYEKKRLAQLENFYSFGSGSSVTSPRPNPFN
jgi:hypothetical protein